MTSILTEDIALPLPWHIRLRLALMRVASAITGTDREESRETLFAGITRDYSRLIAGICLSFARSREDFDDLRQDTFLNIWKGLGNFRRDSSISTWIYRVTLNTCVSFQRKSSRKDNLSTDDLYAELYDNSSPEDMENYRLMYRLIGELKPLDKSIILMWLDSKSYEEIADVTGLTRNAVSLRLKRAKEHLSDIYHSKYQSL